MADNSPPVEISPGDQVHKIQKVHRVTSRMTPLFGFRATAGAQVQRGSMVELPISHVADQG